MDTEVNKNQGNTSGEKSGGKEGGKEGKLKSWSRRKEENG